MPTIITAECSCGEAVMIDLDSKRTCRKDGKRIFYPDADDGGCYFRCRKCFKVLSDTIFAANYA